MGYILFDSMGSTWLIFDLVQSDENWDLEIVLSTCLTYRRTNAHHPAKRSMKKYDSKGREMLRFDVLD